MPKATASVLEAIQAGDDAFDRGELDAAVEAYGGALAIDPTDPLARYNLGVVLKRAGRADEAAVVLTSLLSERPGIAQAAFQLGLLHHERDELEPAIERYWQAILGAPEMIPAHRNLGSIMQRLGRHAEALSCFERVCRLGPQDATAQAERAAALRQLGRLEEAAEAYEAAIERDSRWATPHFHLGVVRLRQGRNEAALACFDAAIAAEPGMVEAHVNRGVVLRALGHVDDAIDSYRAALLLKPGYVKCLVNLGGCYVAAARHEEAIEVLRPAIEGEPDNFDAVSHLGLALIGLGRVQEAIGALEHAVSLRPVEPLAHTHLGIALGRAGRLTEALVHYREGVALDPASAHVWCNLGTGLHDLGSDDDAVNCFEQAVALDPTLAAAHTNHGIVLLLGGDLAAGWPKYEWRRKVGAARPYEEALRWSGKEPISGKLMFVHAEQGFGDTIQFARYLPILQGMGARVVVQAGAPLCALLGSSFPDIEVLPTGTGVPVFEHHVSMMSLPLVLGTTLETIPARVPYLKVPGTLVKRWAAALPTPRRPRVGLVWSGGAAYPNDKMRSMPFALMALLLARDDVDFISLQKEIRAEDLAHVERMPQLRRVGETLGDFSDTAALLQSLDLVISVDTSVAHLAGALGRPVWILLPYVPDWRWMRAREDSPWYPSARLFRQTLPIDWQSVMQRVAQALDHWLNRLA